MRICAERAVASPVTSADTTARPCRCGSPLLIACIADDTRHRNAELDCRVERDKMRFAQLADADDRRYSHASLRAVDLRRGGAGGPTITGAALSTPPRIAGEGALVDKAAGLALPKLAARPRYRPRRARGTGRGRRRVVVSRNPVHRQLLDQIHCRRIARSSSTTTVRYTTHAGLKAGVPSVFQAIARVPTPPQLFHPALSTPRPRRDICILPRIAGRGCGMRSVIPAQLP